MNDYKCCDDPYTLCDVERHKRHTRTVIELAAWHPDRLRRIIANAETYNYWLVDAAEAVLGGQIMEDA
ncbi:hypothetical protein LCGC14_1354030 [marine sediment metagenome]|uniref:Uncharacterized protein n=1 Tax=marine sediment metagenome TaxID=412755 RepID=A0A0F9KA04_9ZZZZ